MGGAPSPPPRRVRSPGSSAWPAVKVAGAATVIAAALVLLGGCEAEEHGAEQRVTAPYTADIQFEGERWVLTEQLLLDAQAGAALESIVDEAAAFELDPDLASQLYADAAYELPDGEGATGSRDRGSLLIATIRAMPGSDQSAAADTASRALGLSEAEIRCLHTACPVARLILREFHHRTVETAMQEAGWAAGAVVDGDRSFQQMRDVAAEVPSYGWTTNRIGLPRVRFDPDTTIMPRAGSRVSIVAPKAMVAAAYPAEARRVDLLSGGEEELILEVDNPDRREVRVAVVAGLLRSPPGHTLYRLGQWPVLPLVVGAVAVTLLLVLRERSRNLAWQLLCRLAGWVRGGGAALWFRVRQRRPGSPRA